MANIEFIYTFNGAREQVITQYPFDRSIIKSEKTLKKFAVSKLKKIEADEVIKISCCVYTDKGEDLKCPEWYHKCNGKLWFDENRIED